MREAIGCWGKKGPDLWRLKCAGLQNLDFMPADPDVDLLKASLQSFIVASEEVVCVDRRWNVYDKPHEEILIECSTVFPGSNRGNQVTL